MAQALQSRWKLNIIAQNFNIYCQGCHTSGTGQGGKIIQGQGKVRGFYFESGKTDIFTRRKVRGN